ncbi:MAG: FHA domain-containing protein [Cyanobacteria bacterium J06641_5]
MKVQIVDYGTGKLEERELLSKHPELPGEYSIGRHSSCCLHLGGQDISRVHGRLQISGGKCYYTDLGSAGGSRVNNATVEVNKPYDLRPDDQVRIGNYGIVVRGFDPAEGVTAGGAATPTVAAAPAAKAEKPGPMEVVCTNIAPETVDVKTFTFVGDPITTFDYKPGQFVTLNLDIDGKTIKRSYSISSTPSRPHTLEITVKRVPPPADDPAAPPGLVSNWLHDNLKCGDRITINPPTGHFTCYDYTDRKLLLVSAGSGITPMMSMSRWICDTCKGTDIVFFHGARTPADIIFRQELEVLASHYPNFKLAVATSRPSLGQSWAGYFGRLNATMLSAIAPDFLERVVYVCGPDPFMKAAKELFAELGLPKEQYNQESFGVKAKKRKPAAPAAPAPAAAVAAAPPVPVSVAAPAPVAAAPPPAAAPAPAAAVAPPPAAAPAAAPAPADAGGTPVAVFTLSGQEVTVGADESILDAAEREGVELDCSCRMGACGTCEVKLLEGQVTYGDEDEPDCEPDHIYTCIARPVGKVKIEA